jgi:hypothetical protein
MKKLFAILLAIVMLVAMCACGNKQVFDTVRTFDRAIICLPDGTVISGEVQAWLDYEDGDQIQVKIDGVTYLVHSSQVVLIAE